MRSTLSLLLAAIICACGGDRGVAELPPADVPTIALKISSPAPMTSAGDTRVLTAIVAEPGEPPTASASLDWSSSSPAVAVVTPVGETAVVTAVSDGTATITATLDSMNVDRSSAGTARAKASIVVTVHRAVASVTVSPASPKLPYGATLQLTATAFDARHVVMSDVTQFNFASSNQVTAIVSASGVVTPLFQFPQELTSTITASVTRDGATTTGGTVITVTPPVNFDYAALMLTDYEKPSRVDGLGAGIAYIAMRGVRLNYLVTWSALSGPATAAHIHGAGNAEEVSDILVNLPVEPSANNHGVLNSAFHAEDIQGVHGRPAISLDSLLSLLRTGNAYVDIHTAAHPDGEIRGQVEGPFDSAAPRQPTNPFSGLRARAMK